MTDIQKETTAKDKHTINVLHEQFGIPFPGTYKE